MKPIVPTLLFIGLSLFSASARADVPPEADDSKSVPYTFTVHGIAGVPSDIAIFFDGCPGGSGEPLLEEGSVVTTTDRAGNRQDSCAIYRTFKSTYDAWDVARMSNKPANLLTGAVRCTGGPSPLTWLDADDSRTSINEELDVKVDATSCSVTSRGVPKRSQAGCSATGGSSRVPLALLLGLPAMLILLVKKRRPVSR